ncbi:MAG: hypothetical protein MJY66_07850 [Bacteroidaceae bacterium]|nr:hypothetical protein [Bacteroidaceae bacterium]
MNNKIQELTDIIYNEGVAKGQAQAEQILSEAQAQADGVIANAEKQAAAILAQARKEAAAENENMRKELKLYAAQTLDALKSQIATVVTDRLVQDQVSGFTADSEAFNAFMLEMARQWSKDEGIRISAAQADSLKAFFMAKAKDLLDGGVEIEQVNGQRAAFSIQPADGSYKVNFGDEEFCNWFKSLLRPQLVDILF